MMVEGTTYDDEHNEHDIQMGDDNHVFMSMAFGAGCFAISKAS